MYSMCAVQRVNGQDKIFKFGLCQELQHCCVFQAQQFPVCINNGPPPKGHPANLTLWVGLESTLTSIPVERFRRCSAHSPTN